MCSGSLIQCLFTSTLLWADSEIWYLQGTSSNSSTHLSHTYYCIKEVHSHTCVRCMWRWSRDELQLRKDWPMTFLVRGSVSQPICLGHIAYISWVLMTRLTRAFFLGLPTSLNRALSQWQENTLCSVVLPKKVRQGMQIDTNFPKDTLHYVPTFFKQSYSLTPVIPLLRFYLKELTRNGVKDLCTRKQRFMHRVVHWSLIYDSKMLENSLSAHH